MLGFHALGAASLAGLLAAFYQFLDILRLYTHII
jgi:hypothetical protein